MDFQGPTPSDYENLHALNFAFLELVQHSGRRYFEGLSRELGRRLTCMRRGQIGWLAATPFLLFSFRERDDDLWRKLLLGDTARDLFTVPIRSTDETGRLVSAGLGFVWQLAIHNPFAARLLCGASTHWCEQITERTLFHLLAVAGHRSDLLVLRAQQDTKLWQKLLSAGLSEETTSRNAAHISALQHILTRPPDTAAWRAAACATRHPTFKVAEDS